MRILGLIPARGGSKGIPRKNVKLLGGKPLICYSIQLGLQCEALSELVVSTDDEEIAGISREAGASVPFIRPAALATDQSPSIDTMLHALNFFAARSTPFDALCLLQPTTPFRKLTDLIAAVALFCSSGADSLISVREVPHAFNPHWVFEADPATGFLHLATGEAQIIPRRQDLPPAYYRDGAIYITRTEVLQQQQSIYGQKIVSYRMNQTPDINIDGPDDWSRAEAFLQVSNWS